jgi:hypothetical protein
VHEFPLYESQPLQEVSAAGITGVAVRIIVVEGL